MAVDIKGLIDTVVIVMMENRSFDHMLGYLSLRAGADRPEIDGITSPKRTAYANEAAGQVYHPFPTKDQALPGDLPHGRDLVAVQLAFSATTGGYTMRGFVEAYRRFMATATTKKKPAPMGFMQDGTQVETMDFFAENFTVCTRWFAPLPADTQPNRLMALSGFTKVDVTTAQILDQDLVYEWLRQHDVRWRAYRSGLPFCTMFRRMWDDVLDRDRFRSIRQLARDVQDESDATFPQVIFCEPSYGDSPVHIGFQPNDDHPPLPVGPGQTFLREIYEALTSNAARWARTLLIVTYDEHGGFFDHVPPLPIPTDPPPGVTYRRFTSTGVRVPGLVVSPLVEPRSVFAETLDHTSILQFLAERYGNGAYSDDVQRRRAAGIRSVSEVLTRSEPLPAAPLAPLTSFGMSVSVPVSGASGKKTPNQLAFEHAADKLLEERGAEALNSYPELAQWKASHV